MTRWLLIMITVLSLIGLSVAERKISGGNKVKITDYPFAVSIYRPLPGSYLLCGGIYIRDVWILSSYDNCFDEIKDENNIGTCCMGSTDVDYNKCKVERKIVSVKKHPEVDFVDLVLVKIESRFPLGDTIQYAKLPTHPYLHDSFKTDKCVSIGWGLTSATEHYSKNLKSSPEKVVKIQEVRCVYDYICSEGGACLGDYGGALICNGDVVGVISYTTEKCGGITFSVNIGAHLDFINGLSAKHYGKGISTTASAYVDRANEVLCVLLILLVINLYYILY